MSFNKSLLTLITEDLEKKKKPSKPRVPKNQWQHPGEVTTIPGNNITMDGVSYPVLGVPNVGPPQMMYPDQQYYFPDAGNVTEYPEMANGGIPERYRNMGFSRVGSKKNSTRPGKKWMVLAKKGDDYRVIHGGYDGMKDYSQHGSEKRKANFWNRMGGKNSSRATDPFSPLYWHKRFGTWADGGQPGLLAKSVNCKSCGHSWKAVDGGEDPLTCHKCGQFNEQMQLGGLTRLASNAARFLQESTMFKNAYKVNPWAFKAHPEKYYRQLGKEGIDDAIKEGKILAKGQKDLLSRMPLDYVDEYTRAIDPSNASKLMVSKPATAPFFKKGQLFFPIERKATGVGYKGTKFSDAEYLAEGVLPDKAVLPRYMQKYFPSMEASGNVGVLTPEFNSLDNFTLYQRDWLRGYKPIKEDGGPVQPDDLETMYALGGEMIRRADGSYSKRGLWDNIRANRGSGNKPTSEMNAQKRRIAGQMQEGGEQDQFEMAQFKNGGHGGLDRWFAEKWVDVKTGKTCGRQEGEKRKGYPACRPSKRVNSDTPKTSGELSGAEKAKFKREKTSSDRINYNHKKEDGGEVGWLDNYQYGGSQNNWLEKYN